MTDDELSQSVVIDHEMGLTFDDFATVVAERDAAIAAARLLRAENTALRRELDIEKAVAGSFVRDKGRIEDIISSLWKAANKRMRQHLDRHGFAKGDAEYWRLRGRAEGIVYALSTVQKARFHETAETRQRHSRRWSRLWFSQHRKLWESLGL